MTEAQRTEVVILKNDWKKNKSKTLTVNTYFVIYPKTWIATSMNTEIIIYRNSIFRNES